MNSLPAPAFSGKSEANPRWPKEAKNAAAKQQQVRGQRVVRAHFGIHRPHGYMQNARPSGPLADPAALPEYRSAGAARPWVWHKDARSRHTHVHEKVKNGPVKRRSAGRGAGHPVEQNYGHVRGHHGLQRRIRGGRRRRAHPGHNEFEQLIVMQAGAQIVHAGGTTVSSGAEGKLCRAFRAAAEKFCADAGKRNGRFNDYFFRELKKVRPGGARLARQMRREATYMANWVGKGNRTVSSVAELRRRWAGNPFSRVFKKLERAEQALQLQAKKGLISHDAIRQIMNNEIARNGLITKPRYPDAIMNGQVVEIKGPTDEFGKGQLEDQQRMVPGRDVIEVSCEACAAPCHAAGNKCPLRVPNTPSVSPRKKVSRRGRKAIAIEIILQVRVSRLHA